ncbi:MAG: hypothetical protein EOP83_11500 [Verrucomicrobiaceae bacterium]|nr:MAG: hypothetical protein EOP83_11500 [Verrucomicrobiaceae bacterium]
MRWVESEITSSYFPVCLEMEYPDGFLFQDDKALVEYFEPMREWCRTNLELYSWAVFHQGRGVFWFRNQTDATLFKIFWS